MYNIYFEVAATGFITVLLLYLHIEYPNASESNRRYRQWVTWILAGLVIDVIASRTTDYGAVMLLQPCGISSFNREGKILRLLHEVPQGALHRIYDLPYCQYLHGMAVHL